MQSYFIFKFSGGWKYTFLEPSNVSKTIWSSILRSIVKPPDRQNQTGVTDLNFGNLPLRAHKHNIPHSMEILSGKWIGDYTDLICNVDVIIERL